MCISGPWDLIMVTNMKKIHHGGMCEEKQTHWLMDWSLSYIHRFHSGGAGNINLLFVGIWDECVHSTDWHHLVTEYKRVPHVSFCGLPGEKQCLCIM